MIDTLPNFIAPKISDGITSLSAPYATFFSGGRLAPRSQAMDQNLQDIIRDQIATTGKGSGIIGYSDYDKSQTPETEFPNMNTMMADLAKGKISPAEFGNLTTLGRLNYDVDPNTGKVTFGSNVYDFRPETVEKSPSDTLTDKFFNFFGRQANEVGREINPNITVPVDELRGFGRDFSQLGDVDSFRSRMERMGGTRQPSSFRSLNNPEVYGELEKQGILESLLSKGKELGKGIISKAGGIADFASNFGIMGMLSKMDNFKNLSQADQQFILGQAGGNRPAKDKYGYNIRSAFGNYGQLVKDRAKLADFRKQIGKPIRAIDKYYLKKENQRKAELQKQIQESIQRESGADSYTNRAMAHESKVGRNSGERMGRI